MRRKALVILFFTCILLGATALTEYLFYRQNEDVWVEDFEKKLHHQELWADNILKSFKDSVTMSGKDCKQDVIFLGFKKGKLFFWTDELVVENQLYTQLSSNGNFIKLGNTFYDVRSEKCQDNHYFALLKIKDAYPYHSKYVKNKFGSFLDIPAENADLVDICFDNSAGHLISDRDGNILFVLAFNKAYKDQSINYGLVILYLLFFLSLFYIYDLLLKSSNSWKEQIMIAAGCAVFFVFLRSFLQYFDVPSCIFRLPIFYDQVTKGIFITSVGDLILTMFCFLNISYITFSNIKINYDNIYFYRYRYLITCVLIFLVFVYADFYNFMIDLVVAHMSIHLNVAQLIHVGSDSIIAFIAVCLGGLVILYAIMGIVTALHHFVSFRSLIRITTLTCIVLWGCSYFGNLYTNFWDSAFIWTLMVLASVNRYLLKPDIRRSVYILAIFILSFYMVMVTKKYEQYKEQRQRLEYATELIEERDSNFEKLLARLDKEIVSSDILEFLMNTEDDTQTEYFLRSDLLNMPEYNYQTEIFCLHEGGFFRGEEANHTKKKEYFEHLLSNLGYRIANTHFYTIRLFDGYITYIGKFKIGDSKLYISFSAEKDNNAMGYTQLLSRTSGVVKDPVYQYSYAKYLYGNLAFSSGEYVYGKKLEIEGDTGGAGVRVVEKDNYSHMLIAVDDHSTLVVSLPERTFSLYYMNTLYAFIVCMFFVSYGLLYKINRGPDEMKSTLKRRIKRSVISLIFLLLLFLTALSIYTNIKSFEGRHKVKAIEFLRYLNKELESLDCVEWAECPGILNTLSNMSEFLMVDINIYSNKGELVATSRPEVYQFSLKGSLINPTALYKLNQEGRNSYIEKENIGELSYLSAYMPMVLDNGKSYILNIPYFAQNDELNLDIIIMIVIGVNIAIVVMVIAYVLSGLLAERMTKPLKLVNEKLRKMKVGGKNEKISYHENDEIGVLVQEYNNMVDKLEDSINQLARSERENAWREMARQIAHEIKNPLTPMKLNIQFMLRSLQMENTEKFKQRFKELSTMLIEQIDNMAATASTFSDFAKMTVTHNEVLKVNEVLENCIKLFGNTIDTINYEAEEDYYVFVDREQLRRVFVNLLKNAEQSIPSERKGEVSVSLKKHNGKIEIRFRDNGNGIPEDVQKKIFEPNFTTKSSGSGLGLAICRRIIENFDGKIGFTTQVGVGTEFYIILEEFKS